MKTLRIFISSPGDVAEEREKAKQVIAVLQRRYDGQATLVPVLWEDLAIPATASFQEGIDYVLTERHRIDIAVFILWSRLGSPLGAAIQKPDGTPYLSGTEREFDLMLTVFQRSGGKMPVILAYTRRDEEGFNNNLDATSKGDDALEELLHQRKLVKHFIRENFHDNQGRSLRAYSSYHEPVGFAQRLHVHLRGAIDDLLELDTTAITWTESPYRSLEVFDILHSPIFCGRDEETCAILQRLRDQESTGCAFVCIVGASGSGKSSLARAGVASTLMQRSFEDGVKEWRAAVLLPNPAQGDLPLALAHALAEGVHALHAGIGGLDEFTTCLRDQNFKAASILLRTAFSQHQPTNDSSAPGTKNQELKLLLILDQMEELWTDRTITPNQREHFLHAIEAIARTGHITVLATLRSDFYPQAQLSETFLRMKGERGHFDLTPPGPAALQQLIVQPAHRAGLRFDRDEHTGSSLDQRILTDAVSNPAVLPLLQYALAELYEERDEPKRLLTFTAYEAMGGVEGALGKRAAQTFDELPAEARAALDELLPLLVSVDAAGEQNAVRRRARLTDLTSTPARRQLTESLIKARFITTDSQSGVPIASLTHEALLRRWDSITTWINTNRDLLRMKSSVEQYQAKWEQSGGDTSCWLPLGLPMEEGRTLLSSKLHLLDPTTRAFISDSAAYHEQLRRRATKRRRVTYIVLGLLTALSLLLGGIAVHKTNEAAVANLNNQLLQLQIAGGAARTQLTIQPQSPPGQTASGTIAPSGAASAPDEQKALQEWEEWVKKWGDAYTSGIDEKKLSVFEDAIAMAKDQLKKDQHSETWLANLGLGYHRLGEYLANLTRQKEAISAYQEGQVPYRKIVARSPSNLSAKWALSMLLMQQGYSQTADQQWQPGEQSFTEGFALMTEVAKATGDVSNDLDRGNVIFGLAHLYYTQSGPMIAVGKADLAGETLNKAITNYELCRSCVKVVPADHPRYPEARARLNVANQCLAICQMLVGKVNDAILVRRENITVTQWLRDQAPADMTRQVDVCRAQGHLVDSLIVGTAADREEAKLLTAVAIKDLEAIPKNLPLVETADFKAVKTYLELFRDRLAESR